MQKPVLIKDLGMLYATLKSTRKRRYGLYLCSCGKEFKCETSSIKSGNSSSCGCFKKESHSKLFSKHSMYGTKLYWKYANMKKRCYYTKDKRYKDWGGRGIKVCDEWRNDFMAFYNWSINNGWKEGLSIDRINNDGNYEPSNCRWTTREVQARNTRVLRSDNKSGFRGVSWHKASNKWCSRIGIDGKYINLGLFKCRLKAAYAYDKYAKDNILEHTLNFP